MKVAMVSTFRTQCGVGLYCEDLSYELAKLCDYKVFAEILSHPQTETPPLRTDVNVDYERCWKRYQGYEELQKKILDFKPDICHFQYVAGVYNELSYEPNSPFQQFCKVLRDNGIKLVLTLHDIPHHQHGDERLKDWYKNLKAQFIVMNVDMTSILREWYPEAQINLIPLGTPLFSPIERNEARRKIGLKIEDFIMTQVGFYGVDKGMLEIIKAVPQIEIPNFKLVFAGGFHPLASPVHKPYVYNCLKTAVQFKLQDKIIFLNKILSEEEINLWASASDFLILNQEPVFGGSTSASAHRILCAGKPIIMSESGKLSEFIHNVHCVKTSPENISKTVNNLYRNKELQEKIVKGAVEHGKATSFELIARKHMEVYQK